MRNRDDSPQPRILLRATRSEAAGASLRVAGLTVLERAVKQLDRAGAVTVIASDGSAPLPVSLPPSVVVRQVAGPEDLAALRAELPGAIELGGDEVRLGSAPLGAGLRVADELSRRAAEDAVFSELLRGDLGLVARYLNKPISFRITRYLLCRLPITPNQVTLGAAFIGLCGAALVATGGAGLMVLGFLLTHLQSVLDGCDGELARVRFQQSAIGEWLDTLVDDVLNVVLFASIGLGVSRAGGGPTALAFGLLASAMLLFYNLVAYRELRRQGAGGEVLKIRWWFTSGTKLKSRVAENRPSPAMLLYTLGRRDFLLAACLVYAIAGIPSVALAHAFLVSLVSAVGAAGQLLWRPKA